MLAMAVRQATMNKLIIAKIFLGLLLGLVVAGVTFPDFGLVELIVFSAFTLGQFAVSLKLKRWKR